MAASNAMNSFDTILYWAPYAQAEPANLAAITAAGGGWTEITDVISINGLSLETSVTDVTNLRSPLGFKEKLPGFTDAGQVTFRLNYNQTLYDVLIGLTPTGTTAGYVAPSWGRVQFALVLPDAGVWIITGFIKSLPVDVPEDNRLTVEVTVEISGEPAFFLF